MLVAQLVQDFGVGPVLLEPVMRTMKLVDRTEELSHFLVFVIGLFLVGTGWVIRRMSSPEAN